MQTIYTKIGPKRLRAIVDRFYDIVFDESKISHLFKTQTPCTLKIVILNLNQQYHLCDFPVAKRL